MRESVRSSITRQLVALALAGVLALGLQSFAASRTTAAPDTIVGAVRVIDGDTLDVGGARIRLEGIDAPELAQECTTASGEAWACGIAAANALRDLIAGAPIACRQVGTDKFQRALAICYDGTRDLNAELVRRGYAWAFVRYSERYVAEEAEARRARAGVWQGAAMPAWEFRAGAWQAAQALSPEGCAIKGNVSRHGQIYHMPWNRWYGRVKIEEARGERWFCTEAEARMAGFRPSIAY